MRADTFDKHIDNLKEIAETYHGRPSLRVRLVQELRSILQSDQSPTIIDWLYYEKSDHVLAWLLVEVMSAANIHRFGDFDSSKLEVELRVNGLTVPFMDAIQNLQGQLKRMEELAHIKGRNEAHQTVRHKIEELFGVKEDWE